MHKLTCVFVVWIFCSNLCNAQTYYNINGLRVGLRNTTQTIGFLAQQGDTSGFSFTPSDSTPVNRQGPNYHHLGMFCCSFVLLLCLLPTSASLIIYFR